MSDTVISGCSEEFWVLSVTWMVTEWLLITWELKFVEQLYDPLSLRCIGLKWRTKTGTDWFSSQLVYSWGLTSRGTQIVPLCLHQVTLGLWTQYFTGHWILNNSPVLADCLEFLVIVSCTGHSSSFLLVAFSQRMLQRPRWRMKNSLNNRGVPSMAGTVFIPSTCQVRANFLFLPRDLQSWVTLFTLAAS